MSSQIKKIFNPLNIPVLSPVSILHILRRQQLHYCTKSISNFPSEKKPEDSNNEYPEDDKEKSEEQPSMSQVKLTVFFPKENISKQIDARVGMTVFEAILKHDDSLLPNACDAQLACGSCHCLVDPNDMKCFTQSEDSEEDLLDAFLNCQPNSRLACQMQIVKKFDNVQINMLPEITCNGENDKNS